MPLTSGTKLGPYEIQSALGAGGMGEVYSALDTRLDRKVAIKILPAHLSEKPEARERFEREARAISSLNHPNICQLYDVGEQAGVRYLVMEHLQGETLADRLQKSPLPLDLLLRISAEVADGLQAAHRNGVVHRDLKPGNIMLTKSGAKLLDFGLAKSAATPAIDLTATLSTPAATQPLTAEGTLLGTFQYMSPEQVEGREANSASDIFSFGSVLYEMASGKRAFDGKSQISLASAILEKEPPPLATVSPASPPALDHVIRGCLAKDPDARWHSAADISRELRWIAASGSSSSHIGPATVPPIRRRTLERLFWAVVVAGLIIAIVSLANHSNPSLPVFRSSLLPPADTDFDFNGDFAGPPVLSSDGSQVVFCAHAAKGLSSIYVQSLDVAAPRKLAGTDGATFPFWSFDNKSIGFFAEGKLKSIPVAGGPAITLADAGNPRGGAWGANNVIVYAPDYRDSLYKITVNQGTPSRATKLDDSLHTTHRWPSFLPDGHHFLYLATNHGASGKQEKNGIYLASTDVDSDAGKLILSSDSAGQYAAGYLLFHRERQLLAQKMNLSTGQLSGPALTVADNVDFDTGTWRTTFTVAGSGVLLYRSSSVRSGYDLMWLDRKGNVLSKALESIAYNGARISPDGKRVALALGDPKPDIWILDFARGTRLRLTFDSAIHQMPAWSPDGQRIAYTSQSGISQSFGSVVHDKQSSGTGQEELLVKEGTSAEPFTLLWPQWSADGKYLAYTKQQGPADASVWAMPLTGDRKPFLVLQPQSPQSRIIETRLSPDGKWLAYTSTDSGREEVYVTSFPGASGRWQISQNGGGYPLWRGDSKEIFYAGLGDGTVQAVDVKAIGNQLEAGLPHPLFLVRSSSSVGYIFDVAPDGQRFLVPMPQRESATVPLTLLTNWPASLNK